jgi:CubicO group peptidase (beta-lactamase class C family)
MRLVEQGYLSLADKPQDHIDTWPIAPGDVLYDMNLGQLLSMTSSLTSEPPCLNSAASDFEACAIDIANRNGHGIVPGTQFFYASGHYQVAGLMAVKARGLASWSDLFTEFKAQTGLFGNSTFDVPSVNNPLLAGGMHLTGEDYLDFLHALKNGSILNAASMSELLADYTASATIVFSPIRDGISGGPGLGEDWHYGFGLWHECRSAQFNCVPGSRVSSPGSFGSYPFWDRIMDYTGVVVRQGLPGTLKRGIDIERFVRPQVEEWAAC